MSDAPHKTGRIFEEHDLQDKVYTHDQIARSVQYAICPCVYNVHNIRLASVDPVIKPLTYVRTRHNSVDSVRTSHLVCIKVASTPNSIHVILNMAVPLAATVSKLSFVL